MKTTSLTQKLCLFAIALLFAFTSKAQIITTIVGNGTSGYSGDGGQATAAQLNNPIAVLTDRSGNTYIADYDNNVVRKVNSTGIISTIAGTGSSGYSGDGGAATAATFENPVALAMDAAGNLYVADEFNNVIRQISPSGIITTIAGNGTAGYSGDGGSATAAQLYYPAGLAIDGAGNLYIGDYFNSAIRIVNLASGIINTYAGNGTSGYSGDGGLATAATLNHPWGISFDGSGNLYIADYNNNAIRTVNPAGTITTICGNGTGGYTGNGGAASAAALYQPSGVVIDGTGNIYIADAGNNVIRQINTVGIINTIAGNGTAGYSGDGGVATAAQLNLPYDVTLSVDASGNLFIADFGNNVVRKIIKQAGAVPTLIGPRNIIGAGDNVYMYAGGTSKFEAQLGAISYLWQPSTGLSDSTISNPYVTANSTTTYTLSIQTVSGTNNYTVQAIVVPPNPISSAPSCSNLVPNGDFEDHSGGCINLPSYLGDELGWVSAGGTCDYYSTCVNINPPPNYTGVPINAMGIQSSSVSGGSYAGLILTSFSSAFPYYEYMQSKLACPLITGQKYYMGFDASWANLSNFACGNIGLLATTNSVTSSPAGQTQIPGTPQIDGSCGNNPFWHTISGFYTGAGEQYITIGDFDVNNASQGICTRLSNNTYVQPASATTTPTPNDYDYNYVDNVVVYAVPPAISAEYTVNCAGLGTPPSNPNNILTETGSPGNLCSWYGPGSTFLGTGSSIQITTPNTPGIYTYTVSVDLSSQCSLCTTPLTNTIAITVLPLTPGPTITPTVNPGQICADYHTGVGTVYGHILSPAPGTSYVWDPVLLSPNANNTYGHLSLPPGVYTVNVSTSNCSGLGTTTFTVDPFPLFTVTPSTYTICDVTGSPAQTVTLTASDPSYTYTWTPAIGTGSVVTTTPSATSIYPTNHIYSASAVNSFGCPATETVSVKAAIIPNVQVSSSPSTPYICAYSNTAYTLTAGTSPGAGTGGSYLWSTGSNALSITEQPTVTTVYSLTETTAFGCTATKDYTLDVIPTPTVSVIASSYSVCHGGVPTLTANTITTPSTPTYSLQYTWIGSGSHSNPYTPTTGLTAPHVYTVQVKTLPGGCISTATVEVGVYPIPAAPTINGSLCVGSQNNLSITNYSAGDTYTWTTPAGGNITDDNPPVFNIASTNSTVAGNYTVKYTNANGCVSALTTIHANNPPYVTINQPNLGPNCANSPNTYSLTASVTSGGTYTWSTGATTNPIYVNPNTTTVYTVFATDAATGCSNQATHTLVVTPNPTFSINVISPVCIGSSVTFSATTDETASPLTYTWSGYGVTTSNEHHNPLSVNVGTNTSLTYTLQGTQGGCVGNTTTITINPLPVPTISVTQSALNVCAGSSATLTANSSTAISYTWSPSPTLNMTTGNSVIATPTASPSIYYVVGEDANGCTHGDAINLNVTPVPVVNINAPVKSICEGNHTTLTGQGANTYTWSPSTGLSSTTGASVVASPSVTTTYTLMGALSSGGCIGEATLTLFVNPSPTLVITPSSNPVCSGTSATLMASGASTYTWSGPGIGGNHSTTVTTNNLSTNTTYTLNGTDAGGCKGSTVLTVSVSLPPVVSFSFTSESNCSSSTSNTICAGDAITITANSATATDYTWNPGNLSGTSVTVTPSSTTVYMVDASDGTCTSTTNVTVHVTNCNAGIAHLPAQGTTTSGTTYALVNTNFTLTNNLTINGSIVNIAPTASITVPAGITLTISGAHLKAVSNSMWQGIVVNPGGKLNITNNSLIEDAVVAVDNGATSAAPNVGNPSGINITGGVFNCNRTAIRQAFYQNTNGAPGQNYSTTYFNVVNSVVTCRCGLPYPLTVSQLSVLTNSVTGSAGSPDLNNYYSVGNYTSGSLKNPYVGQPAYEGIHFEDNGPTLSTSPPSVNYLYTVAGGQMNIFDNLVYGINAINSSFEVRLSAFQFPQQTGGGLFGIGATGGYGINAINNNVDRYNGLYVNNCSFNDMVRGIHNINYFQMDINTNKFYSRQTIVPAGTTVLNAPHGNYGMYIKSVRFVNANMSSNTLANINNGIDFIIDQDPGYNASGEAVGTVTVNNNSLVDQFSGNTYANTYIGNAIVVDNVITPPSNAIAGAGTQILVQNNIIQNAFRGILVRNQQYQEVRDENNQISMQFEPTLFASPTTQYGIQHNDVIYHSATTNYGDDIYNNTITGFTSSYSNPSVYEPKKGIWCNLTGNHYVTCNSVTHAGRGIEFSGLNSNTYWRLNNMASCGEGFVLSANSGGGTIGQQGASGDGSDNTWTGFSLINPETKADNSDAILSPLYVQNVSGYYPVNNLNIGGGSFPYQLPLGTSDLFNSGSPSSTYNCGTLPPMRLINPSNSSITARTIQHTTYASTGSQTGLLEQIVQDSLHYASDSAQNTFINKNRVYRMLKVDTGLLDSSAVLSNFYTSSAGSPWALYCLVDDSLAAQNYIYVTALLASYSPACIIEQNYKQFYSLYINAMQYDSISSSDSLFLENLASSCPLLNGAVVYKARGFHNSYYKDFKHYEDNCPQSSKDAGSRKEGITIPTSNQKFSLSLYPNPSTGTMYIIGDDGANHTYNAEVLDLSGKLLYKQNLSIENGLGKLKLNIDNGAYMLYLHSTDGSGTSVFKIMVAN